MVSRFPPQLPLFRTAFQRSALAYVMFFLLASSGTAIWLVRRTEDAIAGATAQSASLAVEGLVVASVDDVASLDALSSTSIDRLNRALSGSPLGRRLGDTWICDRTGRIVYSTVPELLGTYVPVRSPLSDVLAGRTVAEITAADEDAFPLVSGIPGGTQAVLEVYGPVRNPRDGGIVGAVEFRYVSEQFERELEGVRRDVLAGLGGGVIVLCSGWVLFMRRTAWSVERQVHDLTLQAGRGALAAMRMAESMEHAAQRLRARLHAGPAQEISLALLRLDDLVAQRHDGVVPGRDAAQAETKTLDVVAQSLQRALHGLRTSATALRWAQLEADLVSDVVARVVRNHQRRTGALPTVEMHAIPEHAPTAIKIALYRIVEEALTNAATHAPGARQQLLIAGRGEALIVEIDDDGAGFEVNQAAGHASGLREMRDRAETLGGTLQIESAPGHGTRVVATLPLS